MNIKNIWNHHLGKFSFKKTTWQFPTWISLEHINYITSEFHHHHRHRRHLHFEVILHHLASNLRLSSTAGEDFWWKLEILWREGGFLRKQNFKRKRVYVCVYIYYIYICTCIYLQIIICKYIYVYVNEYTNKKVYVLYVYVFVNVYVPVYVYI